MYKSLIRPVLEYSSTVWSPQEVKNKKLLEKIQSRAVRWISNLHRDDSVTDACDTLCLESIAERMKYKDIKLLEDIKCNKFDIDLNKCITQQTSTNTRYGIIHQYTRSKTLYNSYYFHRVIRDTKL